MITMRALHSEPSVGGESINEASPAIVTVAAATTVRIVSPRSTLAAIHWTRRRAAEARSSRFGGTVRDGSIGLSLPEATWTTPGG